MKEDRDNDVQREHRSQWTKSSYSSGNGMCVEICFEPTMVYIRDSKHSRRNGTDPGTEPTISMSVEAWLGFLDEMSGATGEVAPSTNRELEVLEAADGTTTFRSVSDGTELVFTVDEIAAFTAGVKEGEFHPGLVPT